MAFNPSSQSDGSVDKVQHARKLKRIRDIQFGPITSLPMTIFMLWMVGNHIQLFSIMFVGMSVINPIQALFKTGSVFDVFSADPSVSKDVTLGKFIYAGCCLVAFGVGCLKLSWMGLLPINGVDWIDHTPPKYAELSYPSVLSFNK
eukprot:Tbor_TRINITY_DN4987_c2_g1::TRINITY_DN4987_c2_g1_i1::g.9804::m.9804